MRQFYEVIVGSGKHMASTLAYDGSTTMSRPEGLHDRMDTVLAACRRRRAMSPMRACRCQRSCHNRARRYWPQLQCVYVLGKTKGHIDKLDPAASNPPVDVIGSASNILKFGISEL